MSLFNLELAVIILMGNFIPEEDSLLRKVVMKYVPEDCH
jgi:hypothetical protein